MAGQACVIEKYGFRYEARYTTHGNSKIPVIISRAVVPGLTVARLEQFRDDYLNEMKKIATKTKYCRVADFQGCRTYIGKIPMPGIFSDRSFVFVTDHVRNFTNGSMITVQTSMGCE